MLQINKRFRRSNRRNKSQKATKGSFTKLLNQAFALIMIYAILIMTIPVQALAAAGNPKNALNTKQEQTSNAQKNAETSRFSEIKKQNLPSDDFVADRNGQTATELENGDILIVGGESAEIYFTATGKFGATGTPNTRREAHSATRLSDGRVLITGGAVGKNSLRSTEIFDPLTGIFTPAAEMIEARKGHSATVLQNGKVLIIGGESAEIYDASTDSFEPISSRMQISRENHSTVLLNDGRILVVGGVDENGTPLKSAEIFDISTLEFLSIGVEMSQARKNAVLHNLPDGKIQIIGGANEFSMEIFDPNGTIFGALVKIPTNGNELPELFNDIMSSPTRAAVIGKNVIELPNTNQALVYADGNGQQNGKLFNSSKATITTEALNYPAGNTVIVSGKGFMPSETIELVFYQMENSDNSIRFRTQADESGALRFDGFKSNDRTGTFLLSAKGQVSGATGQSSFANLISGSLVTYDMNGLSGSTASVSATAASGVTGVTFSTLTRGAGITATTVSNGVNSTGFDTAGTLNTANNDYYGFTITPDTCYKVSLSEIRFGIQRSNTGPELAVLRSSVDGFTSDIGSVITVTNGATTISRDLTSSGFQNLTSAVEFRIFGYDADNSSTGTMRLTVSSASPGTAGVEVDGASNLQIGISSNPADTGIVYGNNADFTSVATGSFTSKNWQVNDGSGWTDLAETGDTLTLISPPVSDSGNQYRLKVIDSCGNMIFSNPAILTVATATAIVLLTDPTGFYDGNQKATLATTTPSGLTVDLVYTGTGATIYGPLTAAPSAVGTYSVTGTVNDPNYQGNATQTFSIISTAATVTLNSLSHIYDGSPKSATATTLPSGLTVDLSYEGTGATVYGPTPTPPTNAGTYSVTGTVNDPNYVGTDTQPFLIAAAPLTANATASNKTYDGNADASAALSLSPAPMGITANFTSAVFDDKNVGTNKNVTVNGITISGAGVSNYSVNSTATTIANISAKDLTITATGVNKVYDGTTTATVNLTDDRVLGDVLTTGYASADFAAANAGTGIIVAVNGISISGVDAGNYNLLSATASTNANITAAALVASFTATDKVYDGTSAATVTPILSPAPAGITANFASASFVDKTVAAGKTVTISGITLGGIGASNYSVNPTATTTASITARNLNVTAAGQNKIYDGTATASVTLSDNRVSGDDLTTTHTLADFADANVGTAKPISISGISISGTDAGNYNLVNNTASASADITAQSLNASAVANSKTYDGNDTASVTLTLLPLPSGIGTAFTSATFADKNVGAAKTVMVNGIILTGANAANYSVNASANTTADITVRTLNVTATGINKTYDGTTTASVNLDDDRVSGDVLTLGYTADFADPNVSSGITVNVTGISISGGTDAGNYALANNSATTTANITAAALVATASAANKTYDGNVSASATLTLAPAPAGVSTLFGSAVFDTKDVGTGKTVTVSGISLTGPNASNYSVNATATTTADVISRTLNVTAMGQNKVYDGTTAATVILSDDRVSGDDLTTAYTSADFVDANIGASKSVSVAGISISGADAGNYTANTSATTSADITAVNLTANVVVNNKIYDGTDAAAINSITLNGVISGDTITANGGTAIFSDKNVGTAKPVSVSGITLTGANAGNYTFSGAASTVADITPRSLTVSATASNKTYDGTANASAMLSDDKVSGDDVTTSFTSASFSDANVGNAKLVTVNGISITGGIDSGNYSLANMSATANADITPAIATVTAVDASKIYGDSDPSFVVTQTGFTVADAALITLNATRDSGEAVGSYVITPTAFGTPASNYTITFVNGAFTIGQRAVTVTADAQTKIYGTSDPALTYQITAGTLVSGDSFSGALTRVSGESVGSYVIGQGTLVLSGNYALTFVGANLVINKATATVTADDASKTYGTSDPSLAVSHTGFLAADLATITFSASRALGEDVGSYVITPLATGTPLGNYNITYTNGSFVINQAIATVTVADAGKTYGDVDPSFAVTQIGFTAADVPNITLSASRASGETVGTYTITPLATGTPLANYNVTYVNGVFTISQLNASVTPNTASKTYGDADPVFTGTLTGFLPADSVIANYGRTAGETVAGSPYTISATLSPAGILSNYNITYNTAEFTINQASQTIVFNPLAPKTYGDAPFTVSATGGGSGNPVTFTASGNCSVSGNTVTLLASGSCTITASQAGDSNYTAATPVPQTFTIVPNPNPVNVVVVSPPATLTGMPITVPVNVSGMNGHDVVAFAFNLNYQTGVLSNPTINQTGTLSNGWSVLIDTSTPGVIKVSGQSNGNPPLSGSGTLLNFNFDVIGIYDPACSPVTFTQILSPVAQPYFESNFGEVPSVNITNGQVCIINGTMTGRVTYGNALLPYTPGNPNPNIDPDLRGVPSAAMTAIGTAAPTMITANTLSSLGDVGKYTLSGFGNSSYTVTPSKMGGYTVGAGQHISSLDASLIQQYVLGQVNLSPAQLIAADVSGNGPVTSFDAALIQQTVLGTLPINPLNTTGTWKFTAASNTYLLSQLQVDQPNQDYTAVLVGDVTGNWVASPAALMERSEETDKSDIKQNDSKEIEKGTMVAPVSVQIPTTSVASNINFDLPIFVGDLSGENVTAFDFDVLYNPAVIQPQTIAVDKTGTISSVLNVGFNVITPGRLRVSGFGSTPLSGSGILLNLKFVSIGANGTSSAVSFSPFVFNEGVPSTIVTNGNVSISVVTSANAVVKGRLINADGNAVSRATVILTRSNGESQSVVSNNFGNFLFESVVTGETYTVSVRSKAHTFTPQVVSISEDVTGLNLVAEP